MRRAGVIVATVLVAVVLVGAGFYLVLARDQSPVGFDRTQLARPTVAFAEAIDNSIPSPTTTVVPSYDLEMSWNITEDIYAGYGGALELTVKNTNPTGKLFVYSFGLQWIGGSAYFRNCSVTVPHGQQASLGLLPFGAPAAGSADYQIVIKVAASNALGTSWHDLGALQQSRTNTANIKNLAAPVAYVTEDNVKDYYDRVNQRVSFSDAAGVADLIKAKYPGNYSVLQIAEAYTWMKQNIDYVPDGAVDYWQSAQETLDRRAGDCEDHAMLIASIIGALGGSARVNVILEHAFPTVFVATTYPDLMKVKQALASYYGLDVSAYKMTYLEDSDGYWLVIDPTGFPYAGGLPAQCAPTTDGNWTVLSTYLYAIDATGVPSPSGAFGLF